MLWSVYMEHLQPSWQQRMERFGSVEVNPAVISFVPRNSGTSLQMALASFQASGCPQPVCHVHQKLAEMRVVKNNANGNGGRPFFVCSTQENPCSFCQWGDVVESPKPLCSHGLTSCVRKVKKDGPNQARLFYCCPNYQANRVPFSGGNLSRIFNVLIKRHACLVVRRGCTNTRSKIQVKHLRVQELILKKPTKNSFNNLLIQIREGALAAVVFSRKITAMEANPYKRTKRQ